jgi:hypothetical protein
VESDSKTNIGKKRETFQKLFFPKLSASLVVNMGGNSSSYFSPRSAINSDVQPNSVQSEDEKKSILACCVFAVSIRRAICRRRRKIDVVKCMSRDHQNNGFDAQMP